MVEGHGLDSHGLPVVAGGGVGHGAEVGHGHDTGVVPSQFVELGVGVVLAQVNEIDATIKVASEGDGDDVVVFGVVVQDFLNGAGAERGDLVDVAVLGAEHTAAVVVKGKVVHAVGDAAIHAVVLTGVVVDSRPAHGVVVGVTPDGVGRVGLGHPVGGGAILSGAEVPVVVHLDLRDGTVSVNGVVPTKVVVLWRNEHAMGDPSVASVTFADPLQMN